MASVAFHEEPYSGQERRLGALRPCVAENVTDKFLWSPRISHIWKNLP